MPAGDLQTKPPCRREDALAVVQRLRQVGHIAYFAGGCVRDLLLGLQPKDYDVATDARPERVRAIFANTQAVGQAFGVILVHLGTSTIDVATFRSDGAYSDGRRPDEVKFTSAQEDAQRRDFTVNGLFLDPVDGRVIDYVGGQQDLAAHLIRAIGTADARFEEDHLRLLRAVRFAARFDFAIEEQTEQAIQRHAAQLARISPERVGDELRIMLTPVSRQARVARLGGIRVGGGHLSIHACIAGWAEPDRAAAIPDFQHHCAGAADFFRPGIGRSDIDRVYAAWPDGAEFHVLFERPTARKIAHALRQSLPRQQ